MAYSFRDLVDISRLDRLLDELYQVAGIPSAIIDGDGCVLAGAGWQEICVDFHRKHPEANRLCVASDKTHSKPKNNDSTNIIYTCPHGLIDSKYPVYIGGERLADVFTGQFFHEPPSDETRDRFREQARQYGFDQKRYLAALDKVPVIPLERHRQILSMLSLLAELIGNQGMISLQEKKHSEKVTRNEETLRLTLEAINDGFWDWDVSTGTVSWSPRCYTMLGFEPNSFEVTFETWKEMIHPDDRHRAIQLLHQALCNNATYSCDFRFRTAWGGFLWVNGRGKVVEQGPNGEITRVVGTHTDISQRKAAQETFKTAFHSSPLLMSIREVDSGKYVDVNQCFLEITGLHREQVIGKRSLDLGIISSEQLAQIKRIIDDRGQISDLELTLTKADGEPFVCLYSGVYIEVEGKKCLLSIAQDITDRKREEMRGRELQAQLRQAQKLEAIGVLAGGIAHDFNNILGAMIGFTDMVVEDLPENSRYRRDLEKVLKAGYRAKDLVGQILTFSRQSKIEKAVLQPQSIIKEVVKMLNSSLPSTIAIKQTIAPNCGSIEADPTQVHQILMNLCINAFHAMEETGGVLTIGLQPASSLPESLRRHATRIEESYLELFVSDTGCGISPAFLDKIFNPFFTTKAENKGTGMGLAIVYGIVLEHGGTITVDSKEGDGSTFHIFLPESVKKQPHTSSDDTMIPIGHEQIIFVDDESVLTEMAQRSLTKLGYKVTSVTSSHQALDLFRENPDGYDMLITDQTMPQMTGLELVRQMREIKPSLPAIICTGYSSIINHETAGDLRINGFLYKPVPSKKLAKMIRTILDDKPFAACG